MSNIVSKEIRLANRPVGLPSESDFELAETTMGDPGDGQVLIRNVWMSVDPYMRGRMVDRKSYVPPFQIGKPLEGGAIGQVIASGSPDVAVGDYVNHMLGWREYALADAKTVQKVDPNLAPLQSYLGVLGMPGMTAYAGLLRIGALKDGDNVFVSAGSGAVGSVVCQLAKAHGCYVVGSAGSQEKCDWLEKEAGIDKAINYKTCGSLDAAVAEAFPNGIDVYFENVGGEHLEAALNAMNTFGRIALCGMISQYNATELPSGPRNIILAVAKSLKLEGFVVSNHYDLFPDFLKEVGGLVRDGKMKSQETVEEGIERAPHAFLNLFSGANTGKMLVRLGPDQAV